MSKELALRAEPMGKLRRTHLCNEVREGHVNEEVVLMGWVHRRRDLGGLIFIDLRDRYGITQCVVNPRTCPEAFARAEKVRSEFVLAVQGTVERRPKNTENPNLQTGTVDVLVHHLHILNPSRELPMSVNEEQAAGENTRMQYRYLDLRRPSMTSNLVLRHRLAKAVRDHLDSRNFIEVETPMLVRSTPEGARDYLVPSRVHQGKFYALPQSPQLFKQLLMVSGMDRYFQIARCFRDEDLRADRQPEFTQIDMEMSFVGQDEVFEIVEGMLCHAFKQVMEADIPSPFRRLTHAQAMARYGIDKPDLRFGMELHDITEHCQGTDFRAFTEATTVTALAVPGQAGASRKVQDEWTALAREQGLPGLFFASRKEAGFKSSVLKFLGEERLEKIFTQLEAEPDALVVMAAGEPGELNPALGKIRLELAGRYDLIQKDRFEFLWVVDFPLFFYDADEDRLVPEHHPFTSPHPEDVHLMDSDPRKVRAGAYDLVLNGSEIASGSIRIHQREMQEKVLACIGLSLEDARQKFGFLLDAFEYGAPPHGGIALGFDRMVAICAGYDSIREVIAFPKNASGVCPLTGAPVEVSADQLDILHLDIRP